MFEGKEIWVSSEDCQTVGHNSVKLDLWHIFSSPLRTRLLVYINFINADNLQVVNPG